MLIVFTPRLIHFYSEPEIILTVEDVKRINEQQLIPKKVHEQIFIDSDKIQKLRLNTISFEELYKHPYLSYAQANSIVKMRTQLNGFKTVSGIKKSKLIDAKTFDKLLPYLILE